VDLLVEPQKKNMFSKFKVFASKAVGVAKEAEVIGQCDKCGHTRNLKLAEITKFGLKKTKNTDCGIKCQHNGCSGVLILQIFDTAIVNLL
jgi:hypothetical protein